MVLCFSVPGDPRIEAHFLIFMSEIFVHDALTHVFGNGVVPDIFRRVTRFCKSAILFCIMLFPLYLKPVGYGHWAMLFIGGRVFKMFYYLATNLLIALSNSTVDDSFSWVICFMSKKICFLLTFYVLYIF